MNRTVRTLISVIALGGATLRAQTRSNSAILFTGRDVAILGGALAGTAVVSRFDVRIARAFADSSVHQGRELQRLAKRSSAVTETVLMISGGTVWAISRIGHADGAADVGLHTTESVASGAMFIQVIRGIAGRARPYVVDDSGATHDSDPYDFELLKGFRSFSYRSFPSMHAMASYAAATALSQEMRVRHTAGRRILSPVLYLAASFGPFARMYLDEHWASDIALGAFLGVYAGEKVVDYSHEHPGNPIDRHFLKPEMRVGAVIDARGVSFGISPF